MNLLLFLVHHISNVAQGSISQLLISFRSSAISRKRMPKEIQLNRFDSWDRGVRLVVCIIMTSHKEVTSRYRLVLYLQYLH